MSRQLVSNVLAWASLLGFAALLIHFWIGQRRRDRAEAARWARHHPVGDLEWQAAKRRLRHRNRHT